MPLDHEITEFLTAFAKLPPLTEFEPAKTREIFRRMSVEGRDPSLLPEVRSVEEITVTGGDGDLPARVYRPEAEGPLPTIVLFHGGGWVIGDLDTHDVEGRNLANLCEAVVVSVDYRLAPEHPFPAAYDDAVAATRWAAEHLADLGGSDKIAVAGDSAGGNVSAAVAQTFRDEGRELAGQLLVYPATDAATNYPSYAENGRGYFLDVPLIKWFLRHYAGSGSDTDLTDKRLSPLHGDLHGVAPAVVITAEFDPLRDDGAAYAKALEAAGVATTYRNFDGLIHGFFTMGRHSKAAQKAIEETCAQFKAVLHA